MEPILFVENETMKINDNPMSTCYNLRVDKIKNDSRFHYYDISGKDSTDIKKYSTVIFGVRGLYLYKRYRDKAKKKIQIKNSELCVIPNKFFMIQDMHKKSYGNVDILCEYLNQNKINIIFTFYNNYEARYIRNKTPYLKHLYFPLHIDTSIFKSVDIEKKYDILLYGSVVPLHYPFRNRLFELIMTNKNKFVVHHISNPEKFDPEKCESGLAKLINQSRICIATKSKYDYFLGKYLEISACKSLIAGDIPTDAIHFLKGHILELNNNMSDNDIIRMLQTALQNYDKYNEHIEYLYQYVNDNYSLTNYSDKLYQLIN